MSNWRLIRGLAVSESGFVFLPTTGETFTVNEEGRHVILALQDGKTTGQIVTTMIEEFDADAVTVQRDIEDFMAQLRQYQLLFEEA
jgi:hypothetical protein